MSHRRRGFRCKNIIPIILASIGVGMLCVVILPFWVWILGIGIGLIAYAWFSFWDK